ncbi:MAG: c-type cytochrome [Candidatus Promineifilaceae bacterium]
MPSIVAVSWLLAGCRPDAAGTPTAVLTGVPSLGELVGTPAATIPPLPTLDPQAIGLGRKVYAQHCAVCHGANLEGHPDWQTPNEDDSFRPPPHDASGHTWHHDDALLIETIRLGGTRLTGNLQGLSNMPAFGESLTDQEIAAVLTYIKSVWPEDIRQLQWERTFIIGNQ